MPSARNVSRTPLRDLLDRLRQWGGDEPEIVRAIVCSWMTDEQRAALGELLATYTRMVVGPWQRAKAARQRVQALARRWRRLGARLSPGGLAQYRTYYQRELAPVVRLLAAPQDRILGRTRPQDRITWLCQRLAAPPLQWSAGEILTALIALGLEEIDRVGKDGYERARLRVAMRINRGRR